LMKTSSLDSLSFALGFDSIGPKISEIRVWAKMERVSDLRIIPYLTWNGEMWHQRRTDTLCFYLSQSQKQNTLWTEADDEMIEWLTSASWIMEITSREFSWWCLSYAGLRSRARLVPARLTSS
jgi:hypothetical protein